VRVVIADDSALLRQGLERLLGEAGVEVVALVPGVAELMLAVAEHEPDIAIIDIRMPPTFTHEGAEAALRLRSERPGLAILLLSQSLERRFAAQLAQEHPQGFGYLLKDRVLYTLPVGMAIFVGQWDSPWQLIAAGVIIASIPIFVIYLLIQDQFVKGLTAGAVKG